MDAYSGAFLFSAGIRLDALIPLNIDWQIEGSLYSSLLSLGGKFSDPRDKENSMIKILTVFTGMSSYFQAAARYSLMSNISLRAGYKLSMVRISMWDYFISAKDDFIFTLTYSL